MNRGREQIGPADDVRDAVKHVIDGHGELIRPLTVPVAQQQVAALIRRRLLDRAEPEILESFRSGFDAHPHAASSRVAQVPVAAMPVVAFAGHVFSRTVARIDVVSGLQPLERLRVDMRAIALAKQRPEAFVRLESKPFEVFEDCVRAPRAPHPTRKWR